MFESLFGALDSTTSFIGDGLYSVGSTVGLYTAPLNGYAPGDVSLSSKSFSSPVVDVATGTKTMFIDPVVNAATAIGNGISSGISSVGDGAKSLFSGLDDIWTGITRGTLAIGTLGLLVVIGGVVYLLTHPQIIKSIGLAIASL